MARPVKFKTPEEIQIAIDAYFDSCWDANDKGVKVQIKPYTITGLANALDLSRQGLLEYGEKEAFSDTIKRAKRKVAEYVEEYLFTGKNQTGAIFNLKNNFGWKDRTETDVTSLGKQIYPQPILDGLTKVDPQD